jgi:hypothetical protein
VIAQQLAVTAPFSVALDAGKLQVIPALQPLVARCSRCCQQTAATLTIFISSITTAYCLEVFARKQVLLIYRFVYHNTSTQNWITLC